MRVKVANEWLTLSDLQNGHVPSGLNEQEKNACEFCQHWIIGQHEFAFSTSGSTGTPKKIIFTREQLEASARLTQEALGLQPGDAALVCLDVNFIAGAMMLVRGLVIGMDMIVQSPRANPLKDLSDTVDFVALVPYQLVTILNQSPASFNKLRTIIVGGASLDEEVVNRLQPFTCAFYATYGMTETITHVALQKLNGPQRQSYFQLLHGIKASTDSRGCLLLQARHLGASVIVTNDIIILLNETSFRWIGRYDRVINSGGFKVHAENVERSTKGILMELGIHKRIFVIGSPDKMLGEQVTLVLEGDPLSSREESEIRSGLSKRLHKYEVPGQFKYAERFVETPTQKIDLSATMNSISTK